MKRKGKKLGRGWGKGIKCKNENLNKNNSLLLKLIFHKCLYLRKILQIELLTKLKMLY